jgi:hypothetical protein
MSSLPSHAWDKPADYAADLKNIQIDVLSARCTVHRLKNSGGATKVSRAATEAQIEQILHDLREIRSFIRQIQMTL